MQVSIFHFVQRHLWERRRPRQSHCAKYFRPDGVSLDFDLPETNAASFNQHLIPSWSSAQNLFSHREFPASQSSFYHLELVAKLRLSILRRTAVLHGLVVAWLGVALLLVSHGRQRRFQREAVEMAQQVQSLATVPVRVQDARSYTRYRRPNRVPRVGRVCRIHDRPSLDPGYCVRYQDLS